MWQYLYLIQVLSVQRVETDIEELWLLGAS